MLVKKKTGDTQKSFKRVETNYKEGRLKKLLLLNA
jgi:hypothetical protein